MRRFPLPCSRVGWVAVQLSGCVMFREPVETPEAASRCSPRRARPPDPWPAAIPPRPSPQCRRRRPAAARRDGAAGRDPPVPSGCRGDGARGPGPSAGRRRVIRNWPSAASSGRCASSRITRCCGLSSARSMNRPVTSNRPAASVTRRCSWRPGDPHAQSASWHLIAESLKARNRNGEAAEAQHRADELSAQ